MKEASCHSNALRGAKEGSPTIALIGAPNSGKSTLFNALTGAKVQMGNWPGTSVEISRGAWRTGREEYDVIDFPGAYSLDPVSPDEAFTRRMVVECNPQEAPDLIVVVLDAANIARGLFMVAQLQEQSAPVVIALTKQDVAAKHGVSVDPEALSRATGCAVIPVNPRRPSEDIAELGKVLENPPAWQPQALADDGERFTWVAHVLESATTEVEVPLSASERIDKIILQPVLGPLIFLGVMWVVFQITTTVAAPFQDWMDRLFAGPVSNVALALLSWAPRWLQAFVTDGLIAGVGTVLTFAPLMALMFICLAVLEDSGYMARAAVITDRTMKLMGLPGKAFIPLVVGFGCNVPAISATRVLGHPHQRILTALLIPFTSCTARLAVYVMLASTFFPAHAGSVVFLMYVISIAFVIAVGMALRTTIWRAMGSEPLIIDLPDYQIPTVGLVAKSMWLRLRGFLQTAGGIIVACVVAVFILQSTPVVAGMSFADEELAVEDSAYAQVADTVAPVFTPAGFGSWSLTGPLITGFLAKEAVISTWAQTYALDDPSDAAPREQGTSPLADAVREDFAATSGGHTIAAVWAFMIFLLAYTPCVATIAAQRREIGWRWTLTGLVMQLVLSWCVAVAVFQVLKVVLP